MKSYAPIAGAALLVAILQPAGAAEPGTGARMAADRGCYNCHGEPPRRNIRSFEQIAQAYSKERDRPKALAQAIDRMHHGSLFSHVAAHERLTDDEAALLVGWLFDGGR